MIWFQVNEKEGSKNNITREIKLLFIQIPYDQHHLNIYETYLFLCNKILWVNRQDGW